MKYYSDFSDERLHGTCILCKTRESITRDHTPPKTLLEKPYPENLHIAETCEKCNNTYSSNEKYLSSALKFVTSSTNKKYSPNGTTFSIQTSIDGNEVLLVDEDKIKSVILKISLCHLSYEMSEAFLGKPSKFFVSPLNLMSTKERESFESPIGMTLFPEVGSRMMSRMVESDSSPWTVVQEGIYRFSIGYDGSFRIKIVLREYLGCELSWSEKTSRENIVTKWPMVLR